MNQELLDALAATCLDVNGALLAADKCLSRGEMAAAILWLDIARKGNWCNEKTLVAAGAADPIDARMREIVAELPEEEQAASLQPSAGRQETEGERYDLRALHTTRMAEPRNDR